MKSMHYAAVLTLGLLAACQPAVQPAQQVGVPSSPSGTPSAALLPGMPPAQPRPDGLAFSVKWMPESTRYQQIRREAWREGAEFAASVDTATRQSSRNGHYRLRLVSRSPADAERFESWTLALEDENGQPVSGARLSVSGSMPEHGHGLPVQPKVSPGRTAGEYVLRGVQFSMDGWWEMSFYISHQRKDDSVTLNVVL